MLEYAITPQEFQSIHCQLTKWIYANLALHCNLFTKKSVLKRVLFKTAIVIGKKTLTEKWRFVCVCRMYRRTSNMAGLTYPPSVITALKVQIIFTVDYNIALVCFLKLLYWICHQVIGVFLFFRMLINGHLTSSPFKRRVVNTLWSSWCMNCSPDMTWSAASGYERLENQTHTKTVILNTLFTWETDSYTHRETTMSPLNKIKSVIYLPLCPFKPYMYFYAVTMNKDWGVQASKRTHTKIITKLYL